MAFRSPLATLLRVRRIQEDIARAEVITAQAKAALAEENAALRETAVTHWTPVGGNPRNYLASVAAGRSLAADALAARRASEQAKASVDDRMSGWSDAAARAEGVDRVVTRHGEEHAADVASAEASERDDLAAVAWRRRADRVQEEGS